jgi:molybdopterin-guanine dinucleotide biosynthesis protein A
MIGFVLCYSANNTASAIAHAFCAYDTVSSLRIPVMLLVEKGQADFYQEVFDAKKMIAFEMPAASANPWTALSAAYKKYPEEDLLILSSSLPLVEAGILERLLREMNSNPGYDAYVFEAGSGVEPFCAIYRAGALDKLSITKKNSSLATALPPILRCMVITASETESSCFKKFPV